MTEEQVYTYFYKKYPGIQESTNGWYDGMDCPFCGDPKLTVHPGMRIVKCWKGCFNGFIGKFVQQTEGIPFFQAVEMLDNLTVHTSLERKVQNGFSPLILPKGFHIITEGNGLIATRARNYVHDRGFNISYLRHLGIGYCSESGDTPEDDYFGYIIVPIKRKGQMIYFLGRTFMDSSMRYKNPPKEKYGIGKGEVLFNEDALYTHKKIYTMEGWADAATMQGNGTAYLGSKLSAIQAALIIDSPVEEVVIIPDFGYYEDGVEMAKTIMDYKKVKILDLKEIGTEEKKDPNDLGFAAIAALEVQTPYFTMSDLIDLRYARSTSTH
jgi:DNA primase